MTRLFAILLLPILTLVWSQVSQAKSFAENISVMLILSGDLTGQFDISGPLNQTITTESSTKTACTVLALFRKVKTGGHVALEVWPTFECTLEGQKKTFKMHRSFLDPAKDEQTVVIKYLDQKIKNVVMKFSDLSIQRGK